MRQVARSAAREYGLLEEGGLTAIRLKLLSRGHNYVYRLEAGGAGAFVMRIQRGHQLSDRAAQAQLLWLEWLSQAPDLVVPVPVRPRDGSPFMRVTAQKSHDFDRCVLLRWVPGAKCPPTIEGITADLVASVGQSLARLHRQSRRFVPPHDFGCPNRGAEGLFGSSSFLANQKAPSHLHKSDYRTLLRCAGRIRETMLALGTESRHFGLIHGDPGFRNFIYEKGKAHPIDFDEFGWGYYLQDIAEPLRIMLGWEHFPALRAALLEAYARESPLPFRKEAQIDIFIAANMVSYLNWGFGQAGESDFREFLRWVPDTIRKMAQLCDV